MPITPKEQIVELINNQPNDASFDEIIRALLETSEDKEGLQQDSNQPNMDSKVSDQLKIYFEYTKFHIGLYISLIVGLLVFLRNEKILNPHGNFIFLFTAILLWSLAGVCGAVIAHNTPGFQTVKGIRETKIGPYSTIGPKCLHWFKGKYWEIAEHASFWFGAGFALYFFITYSKLVGPICNP